VTCARSGVFSGYATFSNILAISWCSVLLVEETGENHWPVTDKLYHIMLYLIHLAISDSNTDRLNFQKSVGLLDIVTPTILDKERKNIFCTSFKYLANLKNQLVYIITLQHHSLSFVCSALYHAAACYLVFRFHYFKHILLFKKTKW
jgi:hypothetical protein